MTTLPDMTALGPMIESEFDDLVAFRRDLHAHPELGYEEHRTSGAVQAALEACGVAHTGGLARGTGIVAHIPGASDQAIGLRADMDALPILEETGLAYASTNEGVMHACGHDGHTTMLLGTARVLSKLAAQQELPNSVTFVFQPAEEGGAGGKAMVEDGCLNGSVQGNGVRRMYGLHGWPEMELGCVGTRPGPMLAAADMFTVMVRGIGGHAAYPHETRDPIVAASAMVSALQHVVSRGVGPLDSAVLSVTQFNAGSAHNIIPMEATIGGTVRTLKPEVTAEVRKRMEEVVHGVATAHGCEADFAYRVAYPVTRNDPDVVAVFDDLAAQAFGADRVRPIEEPVMGGEDFSFYGLEVPACFFGLGLLPKGEDEIPSLHHPSFDFNDDAIRYGVEMFCRLAMQG